MTVNQGKITSRCAQIALSESIEFLIKNKNRMEELYEGNHHVY